MESQAIAQQRERTAEKNIYQPVIGFLCLSFFPLMYYIGKAIISL